MAVGPGTDTGPGTAAAAAAAAECSAALPAAAETESSAAVLRSRQAAYEKYPVLGGPARPAAAARRRARYNAVPRRAPGPPITTRGPRTPGRRKEYIDSKTGESWLPHNQITLTYRLTRNLLVNMRVWNRAPLPKS